jgi:ABC-type transporter Mla maintaining outer membrane lipid asymmetry ATPase subunit MlaF
VLDALDLAVAGREHVALLGASGAGKSVALRAALGLERAASGRVALFDRELPRARGRERRALLARVGFVPERDALFEDRSVEENVALALGAQPRPRAGAPRGRRCC